jgi:hypothetical protein
VIDKYPSQETTPPIVDASASSGQFMGKGTTAVHQYGLFALSPILNIAVSKEGELSKGDTSHQTASTLGAAGTGGSSFFAAASANLSQKLKWSAASNASNDFVPHHPSGLSSSLPSQPAPSTSTSLFSFMTGSRTNGDGASSAGSNAQTQIPPVVTAIAATHVGGERSLVAAILSSGLLVLHCKDGKSSAVTRIIPFTKSANKKPVALTWHPSGASLLIATPESIYELETAGWRQTASPADAASSSHQHHRSHSSHGRPSSENSRAGNRPPVTLRSLLPPDAAVSSTSANTPSNLLSSTANDRSRSNSTASTSASASANAWSGASNGPMLSVRVQLSKKLGAPCSLGCWTSELGADGVIVAYASGIVQLYSLTANICLREWRLKGLTSLVVDPASASVVVFFASTGGNTFTNSVLGAVTPSALVGQSNHHPHTGNHHSQQPPMHSSNGIGATGFAAGVNVQHTVTLIALEQGDRIHGGTSFSAHSAAQTLPTPTEFARDASAAGSSQAQMPIQPWNIPRGAYPLYFADGKYGGLLGVYTPSRERLEIYSLRDPSVYPLWVHTFCWPEHWAGYHATVTHLQRCWFGKLLCVVLRWNGRSTLIIYSSLLTASSGNPTWRPQSTHFPSHLCSFDLGGREVLDLTAPLHESEALARQKPLLYMHTREGILSLHWRVPLQSHLEQLLACRATRAHGMHLSKAFSLDVPTLCAQAARQIQKHQHPHPHQDQQHNSPLSSARSSVFDQLVLWQASNVEPIQLIALLQGQRRIDLALQAALHLLKDPSVMTLASQTALANCGLLCLLHQSLLGHEYVPSSGLMEQILSSPLGMQLGSQHARATSEGGHVSVSVSEWEDDDQHGQGAGLPVSVAFEAFLTQNGSFDYALALTALLSAGYSAEILRMSAARRLLAPCFRMMADRSALYLSQRTLDDALSREGGAALLSAGDGSVYRGLSASQQLQVLLAAPSEVVSLASLWWQLLPLLRGEELCACIGLWEEPTSPWILTAQLAAAAMSAAHAQRVTATLKILSVAAQLWALPLLTAGGGGDALWEERLKHYRQAIHLFLTEEVYSPDLLLGPCLQAQQHWAAAILYRRHQLPLMALRQECLAWKVAQSHANIPSITAKSDVPSQIMLQLQQIVRAAMPERNSPSKEAEEAQRGKKGEASILLRLVKLWGEEMGLPLGLLENALLPLGVTWTIAAAEEEYLCSVLSTSFLLKSSLLSEESDDNEDDDAARLANLSNIFASICSNLRSELIRRAGVTLPDGALQRVEASLSQEGVNGGGRENAIYHSSNAATSSPAIAIFSCGHVLTGKDLEEQADRMVNGLLKEKYEPLGAILKLLYTKEQMEVACPTCTYRRLQSLTDSTLPDWTL